MVLFHSAGNRRRLYDLDHLQLLGCRGLFHSNRIDLLPHRNPLHQADVVFVEAEVFQDWLCSIGSFFCWLGFYYQLCSECAKILLLPGAKSQQLFPSHVLWAEDSFERRGNWHHVPFVISAGFPLDYKSHDSNSEDHKHREISHHRFVVDRVINVAHCTRIYDNLRCDSG